MLIWTRIIMIVAIIGYLFALAGSMIYLGTLKDSTGKAVPKSGGAIAGVVIGSLFSLLVIWISVVNFRDASKCVKLMSS